jgi:hypothetical protein
MQSRAADGAVSRVQGLVRIRLLLLRYVLLGSVLGRVGKNEGGFAGADHLQLFPDLHLLFTGAFLKAADVFAAPFVLEDYRGVLFLKTADLAVLFKQRGNPLRPAQGHPSVSRDDGHQQDEARCPGAAMG